MLRQIAGQTPALAITNQHSLIQNAEPEAKVDTKPEKAVEEVNKSSGDKQKGMLGKGNDAASMSRFVFALNISVNPASAACAVMAFISCHLAKQCLCVCMQ